MTEITPVTEDDLHAYVDNCLDEKRRAEVEAWLRQNPDAAADVSAWQSQASQLRGAFAGYAQARDSDGRLAAPSTGRDPGKSSWRVAALLAASLVLFLSGAAAGIYADRSYVSPDMVASAASLPDQSRTAFLVYASEKRHPVEVGADQEAHLVAWLGKRLDYKLVAPNLTSAGFSLVGGRLVPVNSKAGAMLMYEDGGGQRLTVMLGRNPENAETSFRFSSAGPLETFYWIDGGIGYAVTGEVSRQQLQTIAEECYRQFES